MFNSSDKIKEDRAVDSIESSASFYLNNRDPVFIINKKGEFINANNAFCQTIGRSKEEILGINIGEASFLTESARKKAKYRNLSRLIGKETPVYTLDVITKSGDLFLLEIDSKPLIKHERVAGEVSHVKKAKKIIREKDKEKELEKKVVIKKHVEKDGINLSNLFEIIQDKSDEIKRLQSELDETSTNLDIHKEKIDNIADQWGVFQSELEERNYEIRRLHDELDETHDELELQKKEVDKLREELRSNQLILEDKNLDGKQIRKELENKERDLTEYINKLKEKDEEINRLKKELKDKQNEIQTQDAKIKKLKKEIKKRNDIIEEIKTQLLEKREIPQEKTEEEDKLRYNELKMAVEKLLQED